MTNPRISESELQAYVDGRLPPTRAHEIAGWLDEGAEQGEQRLARERIDAYGRQNLAMHALYDDVLDEPLPPSLQAAAAGRSQAAANAPSAPSWFAGVGRIAAMLVLTLAGGVGGWWLHGAMQDGEMQWMPGAARLQMTAAPLMLAKQAAVAHNVYSPDVRRPVEVGADQEQALITWLSRRIGANVRAPKLAPLGYDLIGGRLLPGQSGPVAQFMYQDAGGQRLTLYVSRDQVQSEGTGFRFAQEGKVNVFYWIDGQFGYALSGGIPKQELSRVASSVYEQLAPAAR